MKKNLYEILGVPSDAKIDLIKSVYRSLGQIYHPDRYDGDKKFAEEKMKEINLAYDVLSNIQKRKKYDDDNIIESDYAFKSTYTTETNYSKKKHDEKNIKWEIFKKEFNHTIFGPKLTPQQKAQQRAEDVAYFKRIALIAIGIPLSVAFIFVLIEFYHFIKSVDWLYNRLSDRILVSSIVGLLLGLGLSNPDNYKDNILKNIKIIFISTITVIIISLFIPERNGETHNLPSNCKWIKAGRGSEVICN
jgi:hypothetical protein